MTHFLGWIGNAAFLVGMLSLARRKRAGFIGCLTGNALYTAQAAALSNWPLVVLSIALGAINIYGFFSWKEA